ncbi:GNAT family N-acetyltransferase [Aurantimonas endophytica]|uniref:L-ornithine N(alpha)-acyltransferase n=1 Tax=Aurantimonas endophytica TaxID=1522175 RepID=A0A7W6MRS7_9HYPH|nr:GNAT family N-acetyltransferase [Aurantimonas endophytica]MBB4005299.1 putative hemolysin [Aurantimonas endophytica]MCO6406039.1 GNAT family N-acetyltransferase [Aurantimonas endophytica]
MAAESTKLDLALTPTSLNFGGVVMGFVPAKMRHLVRRFDPAAPTLGRIGQLEVRLARGPAEVKAAQQLRYRVFYEEMSAQPSKFQKMTRRDRDGFDRYCDHLLVIDQARPGPIAERIVGTYRLMRSDVAALAGGFYTAQEFDIAPMLARHAGKRFLELGRSCVLKEYRGKRTVELLWQGIWSYVIAHDIDAMFGCASLAGTDPDALAARLAFLREHASAPAEWHVRALPSRGTFLSGSVQIADPRRALSDLPPLLKGYLRIGGYIGEGAVVDHQFGTTDVLVVLPRERINPRYIGHYGADAGRFAA